jgi:hypothetical protein
MRVLHTVHMVCLPVLYHHSELLLLLPADYPAAVAAVVAAVFSIEESVQTSRWIKTRNKYGIIS